MKSRGSEAAPQMEAFSSVKEKVNLFDYHKERENEALPRRSTRLCIEESCQSVSLAVVNSQRQQWSRPI